MNNNVSTGVGFSLDGGAVLDTFWIWMEQDILLETATKKELATLVDALFEVEPCATEEVAEDVEIPEEEDFQEAVKVHFDMVMCHSDTLANYETDIRVYRSHDDVPYTLRLTNGMINSTSVVTKEVTGSIVVENESGTVLQYPIASSSAEIRWNSTPVGKDGSRGDLPITLTGNALNWGKDVTGTIYYSYVTQYDLVNVTVFGTEQTEIGECIAIAFYSDTYFELDLEPPDEQTEELLSLQDRYCNPGSIVIVDPDPDDVTCYIEVTEKFLCKCTNREHHRVVYEESVQCPEGQQCAPGVHECHVKKGSDTRIGGYVRCDSDGDIASDPEFYKEKCCDYPHVRLPTCTTSTRLVTPSRGLTEAKKEEYKLRYPENNIRFIPVYPEGGNCGEEVTRQIVTPLNCCDEVDPLVWDFENSVEVIPDNSAGTIAFLDGRPPFTVSVYGVGFSLYGGKKVGVSESNEVLIFTENACGVCNIVVDDGCSTVSGSVITTVGEWVETEEQNWEQYKGVRATDYYDTTYGRYGVAMIGEGKRIVQRIGYGLGNYGSYIGSPPCSLEVTWQDLTYANVLCSGHSGRWEESGCLSFKVSEMWPDNGLELATEDDCGYCLHTPTSDNLCWYETMQKSYGIAVIQEWVC